VPELDSSEIGIEDSFNSSEDGNKAKISKKKLKEIVKNSPRKDKNNARSRNAPKRLLNAYTEARNTLDNKQ
jgi:hypothetical protein